MEKTTQVTLNGKLHTTKSILKALCNSGLRVSNINSSEDSITIKGYFGNSPVQINICKVTPLSTVFIKLMLHNHF